MWRGQLGNEGVAALLPGLEQSRLTSLDLAKNSIRVEGTKQLAGSLHQIPRLKRLDLSSNYLVGNSVIEPTVRFRDRPGEQATMFFRDPSGNALEIKAMADPDRLFAKN